MSRILDYLRTHKLAWMLPILILLVVFAFIAWKTAQKPDDPFAYRDF